MLRKKSDIPWHSIIAFSTGPRKLVRPLGCGKQVETSMFHGNLIRAAALGGTMLLAAMPVRATVVTDAAGDFLGTYTGAQSADLDILSASVTRRAGGFEVSATLAGAIGTSPNAVYLFGIDRGGGVERPTVQSGILFDAVFALFANGTARVAILPAAGPPAITVLPGAVTTSGDSLSALFPYALVPGNGFDVEDYRYTFFVRNRITPGVDAGPFEVSDLAPAGGFTANVPEPASWAMMIMGFGIVGAAARRRRVRTAA